MKQESLEETTRKKWSVSIQWEGTVLQVDVNIQSKTNLSFVMGPNGSGKTTFLRLILGQIRPKKGLVSIGENICFDSSLGISLPIQQRNIGYVPQKDCLFEHMDVLDNVAFGLLAQGIPKKERREKATKILEKMDSRSLIESSIRFCSGGQRRIIALARTLITKPKLLLLDEPLSSLDFVAKDHMRHIIQTYVIEEQIPCIWITHDLENIRRISGALFLMHQGACVYQGTTHADFLQRDNELFRFFQLK